MSLHRSFRQKRSTGRNLYVGRYVLRTRCPLTRYPTTRPADQAESSAVFHEGPGS